MSDSSPGIPSYDLLTCGETLLRLSPPGMQRLDQARAFEVGIGGTELNVACLLARLGRRTAWVSRLPEGPLGRIVEGEARRHGVDTRFIRWVPDARLGLMFFEAGPAPRNTRSFTTASTPPPPSLPSRTRPGRRSSRRARGCTSPGSRRHWGRAAGSWSRISPRLPPEPARP